MDDKILSEISYFYEAKKSAAKISGVAALVGGMLFNNNPILCSLYYWIGHVIGSFIKLPHYDNHYTVENNLEELLAAHFKNITKLNPYRHKHDLTVKENFWNDIVDLCKDLIGKNQATSSLSLEKYLIINYFQSDSYLDNILDAIPAILLLVEGFRLDKISQSFLAIPISYGAATLNNLYHYMRNSLLDTEAIKIEFYQKEIDIIKDHLPLTLQLELDNLSV
jgi:hypothetical protein